MNILITGGTGFIGQALCHKLIERGEQLTVLSRHFYNDTQAVNYCQKIANTDLTSFDAIINLAGEPIFNHRWTHAQKQRLTESRLAITRQLVSLCQHSSSAPHTFISASATGFYGNLPSAKIYDELTACHSSFSATLCQQWENEALKAQTAHTRVCLLRTGMVLDVQGGALKQMLPLFKLGLAGKIDNGNQHWAWISLTDQINAILFLLDNPQCQGAYNLVAPQLTTQAEFTQCLASHLQRPAFCHTPSWLLKLILGERAELLLNNQPLIPHRLLNSGFEFTDTNLVKLFAKQIT